MYLVINSRHFANIHSIKLYHIFFLFSLIAHNERNYFTIENMGEK